MVEGELWNNSGGIKLRREYWTYTERFCPDSLICGEIGKILKPLFDGVNVDHRREWILTNGKGGYSSTSLDGMLRRKYHALLVASLNPPLKRWVFLSNMEESLYFNGGLYLLKPNLFRYLPLPTFVYKLANLILEKTYLMPYRDNTLIIRYRSLNGRKFSIRLTPHINSRHIYDVSSGNISFNVEEVGSRIIIKPNNIDRDLRIFSDNLSDFSRDSLWREYFYEIDKERGESYIDKSFEIGHITLESVEEEAYIVFTLENKKYDVIQEFCREIERRKKLIDTANLPSQIDPLVIQSDSFVVDRGDSRSIIAGYHWFGDWGRDSLISLPGLLLVTGRYDDAKSTLRNLSSYEKNGVIPNAFDEVGGNPIYNSVDTSLWFIDRIYQYLKYTYNLEFLREIWDRMVSIIENYEKGTIFGIQMDDDFLLSHGPGLTWMDVMVEDTFMTPRYKKAVEIQALWYNSLRIMEKLSVLIGKNGDHYRYIADNLKRNFLEQFNNLYDVIDQRDETIRPNIIFLFSLDFSMINPETGGIIISTVSRDLLTPFGLRTLTRRDKRYKGRLIGDYNKDTAYHNGCVWPWLLGFYIKSYLRLNGYGRQNRLRAFDLVVPLLQHLTDMCVGSISEIFDGDYPHFPRGCISQAWSVGELLRVLVEDILYIRPPFEDILKTY